MSFDLTCISYRHVCYTCDLVYGVNFNFQYCACFYFILRLILTILPPFKTKDATRLSASSVGFFVVLFCFVLFCFVLFGRLSSHFALTSSKLEITSFPTNHLPVWVSWLPHWRKALQFPRVAPGCCTGHIRFFLCSSLQI